MPGLFVSLGILLVSGWLLPLRAVCQEPTVTPAEAVRQLEQRVDEFVLGTMAAENIPGVALAILRDGRLVFARGYGFANLETATAVTVESSFLIGSITKPFTAVALMLLWEKGLFSLDDPIGNYVGDLPSHWNVLTIRQLLQHTSGIPSNLDIPAPCSFDYDPDNYTRMNFLQEVTCLPLEFEPGTRFQYSTATGYDLLGMLIEALSGEGYYDFIRTHIYQPLAMQNSGWIDYGSIIPGRVSGYRHVEDRFMNSERLDPIGEFAHGGLMSTVLDLARFDRALQDGALLQDSTLELMWANATLQDGTAIPAYGLGFGLTPYNGHRRVGHTGGAPGFSTAYSHFPDDQLSVVVLTNVSHLAEATTGKYNTQTFANELARFFLPP